MVLWFLASLTHLSMPIINFASTLQMMETFGDCLTRRVRFMAAITPAYAHTYQTICLAMHTPGVPRHSFRLAKPKSTYLCLPNDRSITKELGDDYHVWAMYTDGGTRVVDGETFAGWCVISRSPHGRIYVMFGNVVTTEAHLSFCGARTHSNNTAEMTAMIEALFFLVLMALWPEMSSRVFITILACCWWLQLQES